jgi:hypothetical protein
MRAMTVAAEPLGNCISGAGLSVEWRTPMSTAHAFAYTARNTAIRKTVLSVLAATAIGGLCLTGAGPNRWSRRGFVRILPAILGPAARRQCPGAAWPEPQSIEPQHHDTIPRSAGVAGDSGRGDVGFWVGIGGTLISHASPVVGRLTKQSLGVGILCGVR